MSHPRSPSVQSLWSVKASRCSLSPRTSPKCRLHFLEQLLEQNQFRNILRCLLPQKRTKPGSGNEPGKQELSQCSQHHAMRLKHIGHGDTAAGRGVAVGIIGGGDRVRKGTRPPSTMASEWRSVGLPALHCMVPRTQQTPAVQPRIWHAVW